jgi:hypothetical protein
MDVLERWLLPAIFIILAIALLFAWYRHKDDPGFHERHDD